MKTMGKLADLYRNFLKQKCWNAEKLRNNLNQVERVGGVYGIWQGEKLIYFGETTHLNHRLHELIILGRHHCARRLMSDGAVSVLGRKRAEGFCKAKFSISWMVVELGRAELEEYVLAKFAGKNQLANKPPRRFTLRSDYQQWVA